MRRYMIRSVSLTSGVFELDTNHAPTAMLFALAGLYVYDNVFSQQVVSNDPRVKHFTPVDPRR
jgi:hypothetical protein